MIAVVAHPRCRLRRGPPGSGREGGHLAVPSAKGTVAETPAPVPVSAGDCRLRKRGIENRIWKGRAVRQPRRVANGPAPPAKVCKIRAERGHGTRSLHIASRCQMSTGAGNVDPPDGTKKANS